MEEEIKENYDPVDDKPGYVWFSKRNFEIIKIETLEESLKKGKIISFDFDRNFTIKIVNTVKSKTGVKQ